jgi:tetratricopeptide (TPR) repeat protein
MEAEEFIKLLQQPASITAGQTTALEKLIQKAPYFQAARAVRLKGLKEHQEFSYNSALKKTAAYTTNRSVLFDFITSLEFNQNKIARQIQDQEEQLRNITVFEAEEVFAKRSMAIDEAIKMRQSESEQVMDPELFSEKETGIKERSIQDSAKDRLKLGEPLEFDASESHSFSEWLRLTSAKPIKREDSEEEFQKDVLQHKKFELIDKFISKSPKIKPGKPTNKSNLAEVGTTPPESLMTETLARVYLEQKNYKKAIQAYKILILKNPEKSGFFADQIRAIEKLQENNTKQE